MSTDTSESKHTVSANVHQHLGDMDSEAFQRYGQRVLEWVTKYLQNPEQYPVLPSVAPGDIRDAFPTSAPDSGESFDTILDDFERIIVPGLTHWNHPGFMAYFPISGSAPGVLAEFLAAALNVNAMLWQASPAGTELEEVTLAWLRRLIGLPDGFDGVIYDTASVSTLHALAAAREAAVPKVREQGLAGRTDLPALRIYCSEQAHSSIDKAVLLLGFGQQNLQKIPVDSSFRMRPDALNRAIQNDRAKGLLPLAVIATVGTTATTSIDPVPAIAEICETERVWLHVDAAIAGVTAMVPGYEHVLDGCAQADSVVVNPHKWLFTPFDLSALYCRRMDMIRAAFTLTPEYLKTSEAAGVTNLMDTGIQLGRRFRALKLWMILRHFGADGIRQRLVEHMRLARLFADWVDASETFERLAPVPFSVVCFRANPKSHDQSEVALERLNANLLDALNQSGECYLSHAKPDGRYAIRLAIGNIKTEERHVTRVWELLQQHLHQLISE